MKKNDCPSCNGKGHKWDYYRDCVRKCCDCDGSGKLDWLEQIFGKNRKLDPPEEIYTCALCRRVAHTWLNGQGYVCSEHCAKILDDADSKVENLDGILRM